LNIIGDTVKKKDINEIELHEKINKELEEYNEIVTDTIGEVESLESNLEGPALCISIKSEEELNFLRTIMRGPEGVVDELDIQVVVPIENVLRPIGHIKINYKNLIKIKVYNPKINLRIINGEEIKELSDEDIICL